jgi:hypothetical protein
MFFMSIMKQSSLMSIHDLDHIDVKVYPQCCPGGSTERCKIDDHRSLV